MADTIRLLDLLRCSGCRSAGLLDHGTRLECRDCGRVFPVQADIPVMVSDAVPDRAPLMDPALAATEMQRLGIPADPITTLRVRRASGARVRLLAGAMPKEGGEPRGEWVAEYLPRAMRPGEEVLANVRFRNAGPATMACTGRAGSASAAAGTGETPRISARPCPSTWRRVRP